jgi:hypothetical protein
VFDRFLAIYDSRLTETTRLYPGMARRSSVPVHLEPRRPDQQAGRHEPDHSARPRALEPVHRGDWRRRSEIKEASGLLKIAAEACVPAETALSELRGGHTARAGALAIGVLWGYDREGVIARSRMW